MFFIDKYKPTSINNIFFHKPIYELLDRLSKNNNVPHLIIYGNDGVGKNTIVNIFLKMLYGDDINNTKRVLYNVSGSGNDVNDKYFAQSPNHIIIEPRGNNNDKYLIHDVVKVFASTSNTNIYYKKYGFKIVVIKNIEIMSQLVQFSLRRTIEKYSDICRFILVSNSITKVSKPLVSRCRCIKLECPTNEEIIRYCLYIGMKEDINLSLDQITYIISECNNNIKEVLWNLQIYKTNNIYIKTIKDRIKDYSERLKILDIKFESEEEIIKKIEEVNRNNYFYKHDIDTFINNEIINKIFEPIIKIKNKYIKDKNNIYFTSCKNFLNRINKTNYKKIQIDSNNLSKKIKVEYIIYETKQILYQIILCIKSIDIKIDKNKAYRELINLVLMNDFNMMKNIRAIIFTLLITNITLIDIIKNLIKIIFMNKKITDNKKIEAINICQETEYNLTKGRREIIQFDKMFIRLITLFNKRF